MYCREPGQIGWPMSLAAARAQRTAGVQLGRVNNATPRPRRGGIQQIPSSTEVLALAYVGRWPSRHADRRLVGRRWRASQLRLRNHGKGSAKPLTIQGYAFD